MAEAKKSSAVAGLIGFAVLIVLFFTMCGHQNKEPSSSGTSSASSATTSTQSTTRDINARVSFTGTQFEITNLENTAWTNVRFEVNSGLISSGYTLKVQRVEAGATYTVGAMQFANASGERFNPFTYKPKTLNILEFSSPWPEQSDLEGMATFGTE